MSKILLTSIAALSLSAYAYNEMEETFIFNDTVQESSISALLTDMTNDGLLMNKLKTTRLVLHSPGGYVDQYNVFKEVKRHLDRKLITEIPIQASSAAAMMFLLGTERLMAKEAKVLFHETRVLLGGFFGLGGVAVTYTDLKSILKTGKLSETSEHKGPKADTVVKLVKDSIGDRLKELVEHMDKEHEESIKLVMDVTKLSRETVLKKIFVPNKDITLGLKDALELRIATGEL